MRKLLAISILLLATLTFSVEATNNSDKNYTQTQQCEKCGRDGKGGQKCAPGKCGSHKCGKDK